MSPEVGVVGGGHGPGNLTVSTPTLKAIKGFQRRIATMGLCIQEICRQINEANDYHKKTVLQQELIACEQQIRNLDKLMKDSIARDANDGKQKPYKVIRNCYCANLKTPEGVETLRRKRKGPCNQVRKGLRCETTTSKSEKTVFPNKVFAQVEFLNILGLLSKQQLEHLQSQPKKVERRRRTVTTNPKYTANGFLPFDVCPKRKRTEIHSINEEDVPKSKVAASSSPQPKDELQCCYVCYGKDFNLTCGTCSTKYHADCIKVTGSQAPKPHRLPICPKCAQAANKSQRSRIVNSRSKPPLSIMSPSAVRLEAFSRMSCSTSTRTMAAEEYIVPVSPPPSRSLMKPQVVATNTQDDIMSLLNSREPVSIVSNDNANARLSQFNDEEFSDLWTLTSSDAALIPNTNDIYTLPFATSSSQVNVKKLGTSSNDFDHLTSSGDPGSAYDGRIEVLGPKSKLRNGKQKKTVRIARVRLNMNGSGGGKAQAQALKVVKNAMPLASVAVPRRQAALRWQNKLKPNPKQVTKRKLQNNAMYTSEEVAQICSVQPDVEKKENQNAVLFPQENMNIVTAAGVGVGVDPKKELKTEHPHTFNKDKINIRPRPSTRTKRYQNLDLDAEFPEYAIKNKMSKIKRALSKKVQIQKEKDANAKEIVVAPQPHLQPSYVCSRSPLSPDIAAPMPSAIVLRNPISRKKRKSKVNKVSMRRTIIAMTAAANAVMSQMSAPLKFGLEENEKIKSKEKKLAFGKKTEVRVETETELKLKPKARSRTRSNSNSTEKGTDKDSVTEVIESVVAFGGQVEVEDDPVPVAVTEDPNVNNNDNETQEQESAMILLQTQTLPTPTPTDIQIDDLQLGDGNLIIHEVEEEMGVDTTDSDEQHPVPVQDALNVNMNSTEADGTEFFIASSACEPNEKIPEPESEVQVPIPASGR